METSAYGEILRYVKDEEKFLLIGLHGVGKTEMCLEAAKETNHKLLYFSASTLDPWCDLVGIPVPKTIEEGPDGRTILKFARREDLEQATWIFLDELNRAHPKTLNALFEMIQFKQINGVPLKNLKLVSGAINPPDVEMNYSVTELDPALLDRFHHYMYVKANPTLSVYMNKGISRSVAEKSIAWWKNLGENQKNYITPRRLEYLMFAHMKGYPLESCILPPRMIPNVDAIPIGTLKEVLASSIESEEVLKNFKTYSADWILENGQQFVRASFQPESHYISESIKKEFKVTDLTKILPILKNCGQEFQNNILEHFTDKLEKNMKTLNTKAPELVSWAVETRKKINEMKAASV